MKRADLITSYYLSCPVIIIRSTGKSHQEGCCTWKTEKSMRSGLNSKMSTEIFQIFLSGHVTSRATRQTPFLKEKCFTREMWMDLQLRMRHFIWVPLVYMIPFTWITRKPILKKKMLFLSFTTLEPPKFLWQIQ